MIQLPTQSELQDLLPYLNGPEKDEIWRLASAPRKEEPVPKDFSKWLIQASPQFTWYWDHLKRIRYYTDSMDRGEIDRLAITCPPRHGKTEQVTIRRPAFRLENDPTRRALIGAHSTKFAEKISRRIRTLIRHRKRVNLDWTSQAVDFWETMAGGCTMAAGIGRGIAGYGFHDLYIDDPVKSRAEANSPAHQDMVWEWYTDDAYTRLEPDGTITLIMARWHENDLMGRILASEDGKTWTLCHLPALAEAGDELGRQPGEALCPGRFTREQLLRIKSVMGRSFEALYQGRPVPEEGNIILSQWFRYYERPERVYRMKVQSWDCANKENEMNDYSVCLTFGVSPTHYDLLAEERGRMKYPDLRRTAIQQAESHDPDAILIEDAGNGTALIADLKDSTSLPVIGIIPVKNKLLRLSNESLAYESGLIQHPKAKNSPWIVDYEAELVSIPNSPNDDRGDAYSQFAGWAKKNAGRFDYVSVPRETSDPGTGYHGPSVQQQMADY